MSSINDVQRLLRTGGGIVARRGHPELAGTLDWLLRQDLIAAVLPGIYAIPEQATDPIIRMRAVQCRHPDAVLLGAAAARLSFWPEVAVDRVDVAVPNPVAAAAGFRFSRRRLSPEVVVQRSGLRCSSPALTALDLATMECADPIDAVLRKRMATLDSLYRALQLTPNRRGNLDRRRLLVDSRNEPWSAAERLGHRLLRGARIVGWISNFPVVLAGNLYFIDVAFPAQRLAIEIDGRLHETDEDLFQSDRWRQNALMMSGWRVLRFTWEMLRDHPELVIATIRRALRP